MSGEAFGGNDAMASQDPERDWKIKSCPLLFDIGRSEIDRDLVGRYVKTAVFERRPDPFPRLLDAGVGEPHKNELRKTVTNIHLDIHGEGVDPQGKGASKTYHAGFIPLFGSKKQTCFLNIPNL